MPSRNLAIPKMKPKKRANSFCVESTSGLEKASAFTVRAWVPIFVRGGGGEERTTNSNASSISIAETLNNLLNSQFDDFFSLIPNSTARANPRRTLASQSPTCIYFEDSASQPPRNQKTTINDRRPPLKLKPRAILAQSAETRKIILSHLSSPQCKLFSQIEGYFKLTYQDLDKLVTSCAFHDSEARPAMKNLMGHLMQLEEAGTKFKTMEALIEMVEGAELEFISMARRKVLETIEGADFTLLDDCPEPRDNAQLLDALVLAGGGLDRTLAHLKEIKPAKSFATLLQLVVALENEERKRLLNRGYLHVVPEEESPKEKTTKKKSKASSRRNSKMIARSERRASPTLQSNASPSSDTKSLLASSSNSSPRNRSPRNLDRISNSTNQITPKTSSNNNANASSSLGSSTSLGSYNNSPRNTSPRSIAERNNNGRSSGNSRRSSNSSNSKPSALNVSMLRSSDSPSSRETSHSRRSPLHNAHAKTDETIF